MKNLCYLIFLFLLISCGASFEEMDAEKFNIDIAQNVHIKSPEELIKIYYNYPSSEGTPNLQITKKEISKQVFEIILIHDHQEDDSQKAEKIVMIAKRIANKWQVQKILRNWKCYEGRGHENWGTENCH